MLPPETGAAQNNPDCEMIDAQLTTELFGLMAPRRPDVALQLAELPIRVTACGEAEAIARFYVVMHSLAAGIDASDRIGVQLREQAVIAREVLPEGAPLQRADLIFWKGHVGWMADAETLLHANAHHMAVAYEPLKEAAARIEAKEFSPITSRRRIAF